MKVIIEFGNLISKKSKNLVSRGWSVYPLYPEVNEDLGFEVLHLSADIVYLRYIVC